MQLIFLFFIAALTAAVLGDEMSPRPGYVHAPGGRLLHRDCIHPFPVDPVISMVNDDVGGVVLKGADGSTHNYPPCPKSPKALHGAAWRAWTQYENSGILTSHYGEWAVPPAPKSNDGQILYFWNGVEPDDNSAVLQPVLQWGSTPAGGGSYWAAASWYVSSERAFFSKIIKLSTGDTVKGNNVLNANKSWTVTATSAKTGKSTFFSYQPPSADYTYAYQVLEAYSVSNCKTDYPVPNKIVFNNIKTSVANKPVVPTWQPMTQTPSCSEAAQVASPTQTSITWK